jgi:MFS family permease
MFALMREPRRRDRGQPEGSLRELVAVIKSRRAILIPHFAGVTLYQVYAYAFLAWLPAFLMRVHGWSMTDVGLKYGVIHVAFGLAGATAGGAVARKLWQRGRRDANLLTGALFFGAMVTPAILGTMVSDAMTSAVLLASAMGFASGPIGSNVAALQEIIPNRLRGRVTAIYYAIIALGGVTLGPLIIGLMNDHLFVGDLAIGKSMSLTALVTLPSSSVLLFIAARRRTKLDWAN